MDSLSGELPGEALTARGADPPAPRLARAITFFCLGAIALLSVINVFSVVMDPVALTISLVCVAVVLALQFLHCSPAARAWPVPTKAWTLTIQAVFTYLPMAVFSTGWGGMAGCLAASVLLAVRGLAAWVLFFTVAASMLILPPALGATVGQTVYVAVSTMLIGLVLYGLSRLTDLVHEVHATRGELARLAIAEERLRFARDLHDLLGYSLSAITLKSRLTSRLMSSQPDRAQEEIESILRIARQALADVRMVASGYRHMSLLSEVASARAILAAAEVEVAVTTAPDLQLPPAADAALATTLREGVTNILRHSAVRCCRIALTAESGWVRLSLVNDGVLEPAPAGEPHGGNGLGNLAARLAELGGRLAAGAEDGGRFRLLVEVPAGPDRSPSGPRAPGRPEAARTSVGDGQDARSDRAIGAL